VPASEAMLCAWRDLGLVFYRPLAVSFFNNLEEVVKNLSVWTDAFVMSALGSAGGL
jgi:hypothetical protein